MSRKKYRIPKKWLHAFSIAYPKSRREFIADDDFAHSLLAKIIESNYQDKASIEALDKLAQFNKEYYKGPSKNDPNSMHGNQLSNEIKTDKYGNPKLDKNGKPIKMNMRELAYSTKNSMERDSFIRNIYNKRYVEDMKHKLDRSDLDFMSDDSAFKVDFSIINYLNSEQERILAGLTEDQIVELIDNKESWETFLKYLEKFNESKKKKEK